MRTLPVFTLAFLLQGTAFAATLKVEVQRHGFTGPIEVAVAPRVDGEPPRWSATKTLAAQSSAVTFPDLAPGLYVVMASGPRPLQRLSSKANVGSQDATLRLAIPRSKTELRATLAGKALPRAAVTFTHQELRWHTEVATDGDGAFAGELWEPGVYTASVAGEGTSAHSVRVLLSEKPLALDVPDRHVRGRVLAGGQPLAGALVVLRTENSQSALTVRARTGADGRFAFFGVREGAQTLTARAPSYLDSDAARFELRGAAAQRSVDFELARGEARPVRVVDWRDRPIHNALLLTACDGHVKSTAVTTPAGDADVAVPPAAACTLFVLPEEGSLAIERITAARPLVVRVPEGASSLRLALRSEAGQAFSALSLLLRIDGVVIPPEIAMLLATRGFSLVTDDEGSIVLQRIPRGTYDFWPYRTPSEGQMLYETASELDAPISVKVLTGENNATVRFQAR